MTDTERAMMSMLVAASRRSTFGNFEPPGLGDLVVEVTNFRNDPDAIGWLVDRRGPVHSPTILVIRSLHDGVERRWENAEVRAMTPALAELARKLFPDSVPRPQP